MRQSIVAGNWKMNGSISTITALLDEIKRDNNTVDKTQLIVFPPFPYLGLTEQLLTGSGVLWGAQNVNTQLEGAYTGEVSPTMCKDFHCDYVIVGHSERRTLYQENDLDIANKFAAAQQVGLTPVFCVGENQTEHEANATLQVVQRQLQAVLDLPNGVMGLQNAVIAYEPIWAIGTGLVATPEQTQEVHHSIRQQIAASNENIAESIPILYGGSVKSSNAEPLFAMPDIDGALVGGASLVAREFLEIGRLCNNC